jgi:hypothetical protein
MNTPHTRPIEPVMTVHGNLAFPIRLPKRIHDPPKLCALFHARRCLTNRREFLVYTGEISWSIRNITTGYINQHFDAWVVFYEEFGGVERVVVAEGLAGTEIVDVWGDGLDTKPFVVISVD